MSPLRIREAEGEPVRPEDLALEDGALLVRIARESVRGYLEFWREPELGGGVPEKLMRPGAAFVTIERVVEPRGGGGPGYELRGCIGSTRPVEPLAVAVAKVAIEAAVGDPRFPPMRRDELDRVVFEVTVLGPLEELPSSPAARIGAVEIGVHGLLVEKPPHAGLLLPQVAVEEGWDPAIFLTWACIKAGLPGTCWHEEEVRIYRFTGRVFREREPWGDVYERDLRAEARGKGLG